MNGTPAGDIAVIRARLPYVDRRALSQAWFSALRLAGDGRAATLLRRGPAAHGASPPRTAARSAQRGAERDSFVSPRVDPRARRRFGGEGGGLESVVPRGGARTGGRGLPVAAAVRYAPVRASFGLALDGGRVQILVRREGLVLHVIALCSRRHVELVRRALDAAALHLRERGESLRADVRAVGPEGVA